LGPVDSYHHFPLETVARDISDNKLLACSDGAFDSTQGTGTFGWGLPRKTNRSAFAVQALLMVINPSLQHTGQNLAGY
jgi:hypothetical protein